MNKMQAVTMLFIGLIIGLAAVLPTGLLSIVATPTPALPEPQAILIDVPSARMTVDATTTLSATLDERDALLQACTALLAALQGDEWPNMVLVYEPHPHIEGAYLLSAPEALQIAVEQARAAIAKVSSQRETD